MRGVAMSEGVYRDAAFYDPGGDLGLPESALNAIDCHRCFGRCPHVVASAQCRENQDRVLVGDPIPAKQHKCLLGQGNEAILGALAPMDMEHHAGLIDIGYLYAHLSPQAYTAG